MSNAKVDYLIGRTLNLGDMEFVRIQVGLSLECIASKEEIGLAFSRAKRFVDAKIAEQEHEWKVGGDEE